MAFNNNTVALNNALFKDSIKDIMPMEEFKTTPMFEIDEHNHFKLLAFGAPALRILKVDNQEYIVWHSRKMDYLHSITCDCPFRVHIGGEYQIESDRIGNNIYSCRFFDTGIPIHALCLSTITIYFDNPQTTQVLLQGSYWSSQERSRIFNIGSFMLNDEYYCENGYLINNTRVTHSE
jgi:hypothetical protein